MDTPSNTVAHDQLGRLISEHGPDRDRLLAHGVVACLVATFFLSLLVYVLIQPASTHALHVKVIAFLFFGGFCGGLIALAVYYLQRLAWRIHLHERGMIVIQRSREHAIFWDDIQYLYQTAHSAEVYGVPIDHHLTIGAQPDLRTRLVTIAGQQFLIDNTFRDLIPLTIAITAGAMASLRLKAKAALRQGESIPFGPITLSKAGLAVEGGRRRWWEILSTPLRQALSTTTLAGGSLTWPEVGVLKIEAAVQGPQSFFQLVVTRKNQSTPWAILRIPDIPNFELFTEIVEDLHGPIASSVA